MKLALAQVKLPLGDFHKNGSQVLKILKKIENKAELAVFPEGGLWGYPPKDFLNHEKYFKIQEKNLNRIHKSLKKGFGLLLPTFIKSEEGMKNGVFLFEKNKKPVFFAKEFLPDKGVFFESRYFERGRTEENFFFWNNQKIQILICEDLWQVSPQAPADLLIAINASPYTDQKPESRLKRMHYLTSQYRCPAIYLNRVGAQDSLIFDGASFALNCQGDRIWQGAFFKEEVKILNISNRKTIQKTHQKVRGLLNIQQAREQAIVLGIRDFFAQTGFSKAILGLSGGLDSALTTYLTVQALGARQVKVYFLPGPHTQSISFKMARLIAHKLKVELREKDINSLYNVFLKWFFNKRACRNPVTLQNIQSRLRALILMSASNESSSLLLSTGNKSEIAVGYATLYGDLCGALCPIGDLWKSQVYDLARYINKKRKLFPNSLLLREPSAELAPRQKDRDDLLPYHQLDPLLEKILQGQTPKTFKGREIENLVQKQEFKRAQAPIILKLSEKDLGESWKKPIAHKFS